MKRLLLGGLLALLAGDGVTDLEGEWTLVRTELFGKPITVEQGKLVVKGDRFTRSGTDVHRGQIKYDAGTEPKTFEMTAEGVGKPIRVRGIYKVAAGLLYECSASRPGGSPPKEFSSGPGSRSVLVVWKRDRPAADAKAEGAEVTDGTWRLVSRTFEGRRSPEASVAGKTLTITRGSYVLRGSHVHEGSIRADPTKTPKQADWVYPASPGDKPSVWPGIYKVEGDTLTVCTGGYGRSRPSGFSYVPNVFAPMEVHTRAKP
jgi:uncharacterized protein (TIGR03067 family)